MRSSSVLAESSPADQLVRRNVAGLLGGIGWLAAGFVSAFAYIAFGCLTAQAVGGNGALIVAVALLPGMATAYLAVRRATGYLFAYLAGGILAFFAVVAFVMWVFSQPNAFVF